MKGKYIVWIDEQADDTMDVYTTDSPFWGSFFRDNEVECIHEK